MESKREGNLFRIDTFNTKRICDRCSTERRACSKEIPSCARCLKLGLPCTRERILYRGRLKSTMVSQGWRLPGRAAPLTWAHVIESYPGSSIARFYMRRFVMPMMLILPKPAAATDILRMASTVAAKHTLPFPKVRLQIEYSSAALQETFDLATRTFFYMYNTFFPLFSEEAFHAKPRSQMLRRVIFQIGLERMQQTDLTREALLTNAFNPLVLLRLPPNLDTLQCLLLAQFGVQSPSMERIRFRIFCFINRLIPLLGLQFNLDSPQWLERTLALQMESLCSYSLSIGQFVRLARVTWVEMSDRHLKPNFLPRKTNANHFPHLSDRIHFITSQTLYHSYSIVVAANKDYLASLHEQAPGSVLAKALRAHKRLMEENFLWGWSHLSHLARVSPSPLLVQSRLTLVLRYQNDFLELMKLGLHVPQNTSQTIYQKPQIYMDSPYSRAGLNKAIHLIDLICTLRPAPFAICPLLVLMPPMAFLMEHCKTAKFEYSSAATLHRILYKARSFLARYCDVPFYGSRASSCLDIVDFFLRRHKIPNSSK